ncbi:DUF938 domain-containing protein [Pseudooceanicola atlanticus]|uniref:Methyltransferase n=1 Tax=Pseudooceanicola atlanticus TaxID=1461694 RepID=A0A0A0E9G6_9RHOB|nr:DUF938 domain-containing protein [Pseudooceanicola atlanticus]KGM47631.1 methyltransferase [Pseudooceanicola atlanticus]
MTGRSLPPAARVAEDLGDGRLHLPAAERNAGPISDLVAGLRGDDPGQALEIASGSGQHVVRHAARLPLTIWQPTEVDPVRLASIDAYAAEAGLANIRPAVALDATRPGWAAGHEAQDLVLLVNLLHLIAEHEATTLIREAATALAPGGVAVFYGPFMRSGQLTSDGDARFHADLRAADPQIGYKDDRWMLDLLKEAGLTPDAPVEMPANNLAFVGRRPL